MRNNRSRAGLATQISAVHDLSGRKLARERAVELAANQGRSSLEVLQSDWEQAKREIAGAGNASSKTAKVE
jgi:hypothetical protein